MPPRRNPPVTAECLLHDLSIRMEHFLRFLEADLSPAIAETSTTLVDFISRGANSRSWILHLQTILRWSSLALEEEEWLQMQGLDLPRPGRQVRGVWSMPSFLRHLGRSSDHNACSALQLGRKLRRFEIEFCEGIALLFAPVLPTFRRLSLIEEAKAMQLLRASHTNILIDAQRLLYFKSRYQALVPRPILPIP
ncbi:unnamed protein product [Penicillium nalgiovense]|uniref:Uncharacterized protein n=1 Tax=Penicillium nalgiovense TaxID=60175 RepID=A0A9W4IS41_PENNA|nr:unnamed protein product [Penicillium nalgiovense]CAG8001411.1 unnamed protein product [Penicillium nalgiovense]CAG8007337.1 unnamed protein product [Penicillium nalgiovense]CAG8015872.1 unnamed protein product [Penicillium nalgiovense]CAG8030082.1 unnamed protein product [Penicillium nalgiovense]